MADGAVRCIDSEIPFAIPDSWTWCRMQDVLTFINGRAYKKEELLSKGKYKVLRVGNFFTNNQWYYSDLELPEDKYCNKGDLLYAWSASFGPQIWEGDKTIFHYHIWNVKFDSRVLCREYLYYFFLYDKMQVKSSTTGSTMIHVSMKNMKPRLIPVPPIKEQIRVTDVILQLLPLAKRYDLYNIQKETLNNGLNENLKNSILQEAIQGRLVPQIESEGTAEQLLAEIAEEKKWLVKEGKLKKSALAASRIFRGDDNRYRQNIDGEEVIIDDRLPFEIPDTWRWTTLGELILDSTGLSYKKENLADKRDPMVRVLRGGNIEEGQMMFRADDIMISAKYVPDNLYLRQGTFISPAVSSLEKIGKTALVEQDYNNVVAGGFVLLLSPLYSDNNLGKYLYYFFQTGYYHNYCRTITKKSGQAFYNLSRPKLKQCYVPIPPKEELPRILSQIDKALAGIMSR